MKFRKACPEDRAEWIRMRHSLWPHCSEDRNALEMQQFLVSESSGIVLVAEQENGSLCGFAEISIRHDHVEGTTSSPVPYLEGWYVDAQFRGRGVGRRLLECAEQWAAARGFTEFASDAEIVDEQSIATHLACGFREISRTAHFLKRIRSPNKTTPP